VSALIDRIDQVQRRHRVLAFPYAVLRRYVEDRGSWVGSLISYYGFFSLFPLLVVFVTVASWVLDDRPELLQDVLQAVWSRVPFLASTLQTSVEREVQQVDSNVWVMIVSLGVMLWGGVGAVRVLQDSVNRVWGVARFRRQGYLAKVVRGLAMLSLLGLGLAATGVVAGLTVTAQFPVIGLVAVAAVNIVLATAITVVIYRLSIADRVALRDLAPGAVIVGVGAYGLTLIAGFYVQRVIARMSSIYGPFATTIGLLAYVSLAVQLFVLATEVNVVRAKRLWPRSLTGGALGPPDDRAIELTLNREQLFSRAELVERGHAVDGRADGAATTEASAAP
jgi:membrane protein